MRLQKVRAAVLLPILLILPLLLQTTAYGQNDNTAQPTTAEKKEPRKTPTIADSGDGLWRRSTHSMFSAEYYFQLDAGLWSKLRQGFSTVSWPGLKFFQKQGWLCILQILLSVALSVNILRRRSFLEQDERWQFIARRPFASGIFVGFFAPLLFYQTVPSTWRLTLNVILIIAIARIIGAFVARLWGKRVIYLLAIFLIATQVLETFNLPLPLFRLYVLITAVAGVFLCSWRARESVRRKDSVFYVWALRLGSLIFLSVITAEIGGYSSLATHLLKASLTTIFTVLAAWVLMLMARSTLEWVVQSPSLQKMSFLQSNADVIVRRSALLINVLIGALFATFLLVIWKVHHSPIEAIKGIFAFGFTVGSRKITLGLILSAATVLYGSFLTSWAVQTMLVKGVFDRRDLQVGVRISITRLIHYGFVFVGFLLALVALGVQLRDITIIAGALGIGIGFGLQGIVNNFVSGLILLFERPVKVGDYVQLGEQWAEIKKIGLRATIVETFDRSEIVVPNSDLVSNQVTNWTLSHRIARIIIPVGVEYGSDVPLVIETLRECALANSKVMKMPEPQILFLRFGESSLDFDLRVWIANIDERLVVTSQLHQEIDRRFRQAGLVIAFPQRDLHLRSVDESAGSNLTNPAAESDA